MSPSSTANFQQVLSLLNTARAKPERESALRSVMQGLPDGGAGWVEQAWAAFRRLVVRAHFQRASQLSAVIVDVAMADGTERDRQMTSRSVARLVRSIRILVVHRNGARAQEQLLPLIASITPDKSLRWCAWVWLAAAAGYADDVETAKTAADSATTLAQSLDPYCRAVSLAVRAGVAYSMREGEVARQRSQAALKAFESQGYRREMSSLWLLSGRAMIGAGREREGLQAMQEAVDTDAEWVVPAIALARRAVLAGRLEEAKGILQLLTAADPPAAEAVRELNIIGQLERGELPFSAMDEYLWMRERPLTSSVVEQLLALVQEQRHAGLSELLAWELESEGWKEAAEQLFKAIVEDTQADESLRLSAAAGLRTVAQEIDRELVVGPLHFLVSQLETESHGGEGGSSSSSVPSSRAEVFWARRALIAGNLEEAEDLLQQVDGRLSGSAETDDDLARERHFVHSVRQGAIPPSVASEYVWLRERPLTEAVLRQLDVFVEENRGALPLREQIAWDLLRDGRSEHAGRHFKGLLDERKLQAESQDRVGTGLQQALTASGAAKVGPGGDRFGAGGEQASDAQVHEYIWSQQRWPSILDTRSLLFVGTTVELPADMPEQAEPFEVADGQTIHAQGEQGRLLYFVTEGLAVATRSRGADEELAQLGPGAFFGEVGSIFGFPNTASVVALGRTSLRAISLARVREQLRDSLVGTATNIVGELRYLHMSAALKLAPLDGGAAADRYEQIYETNAGLQTFQQGELLVRADQRMPKLWLIVSGYARVFRPQGDGPQAAGFLCPGDLVGELDPSPVSVRAEKTITAMPLDRELIELLARNPDGDLRARFELCRAAAESLST